MRQTDESIHMIMIHRLLWVVSYDIQDEAQKSVGLKDDAEDSGGGINVMKRGGDQFFRRPVMNDSPVDRWRGTLRFPPFSVSPLLFSVFYSLHFIHWIYFHFSDLFLSTWITQKERRRSTEKRQKLLRASYEAINDDPEENKG